MTVVMMPRAMSGSGKNEIDVPKWRELSVSRVKRLAFEAPSWNQRLPLPAGHMPFAELQPGMRLRQTDIGDRVTRAELPAGINITLVVNGETRVRYHDQSTTLGPSAPSSGLLVPLPEATEFIHSERADGCQRTLTLSLTPDWLIRHGYTWPSTSRATRWSPSPELLALAARLFDKRLLQGQNGAHHLQLAGFGLAMAGEALAAGDGHGRREKEDCHPARENRPTDRRLQRLMSLIESGEAYRSSQTELARRLCMSLSSLQRRFRAHHGESLGRFLRCRRLAIAHAALQDEGVSIEAAATLAGYTSAANFATAFKREFGTRPSAKRRGLENTNFV